MGRILFRFKAGNQRRTAQDRSDHGVSTAAPLAVTMRLVEPGTAVITVCGQIDMSNGALFEHQLVAEIRPGGPRLVVDLTAVEFMGAAALTALLTVDACARASGDRGISIVARTHAVVSPLTAAGLHQFFDMHPDLAHACAG